MLRNEPLINILYFFLSNTYYRSTTGTTTVQYPENIKIGMTTAYAVIFVIALLGNGLGLLVVLKKSSRSTSVTNLFIANMAAADLLLTVTLMLYQVAYLLEFWGQ